MTFVEKVYRMDVSEFPAWKKQIVRLLQFILGMFSEFSKDNCVIRAQGMAYTSLLALVPLFAIMFAMFAAFPAFEETKTKVQTLIFSKILPTQQDVVLGYMEQFSSNITKLGLVGVIGFLVTAILMLDNIEKNFNGIWQVKRKRKFVNKLTSYTTILIFGSFLMGASISITTKIKSMFRVGEMLDVGFIQHFTLWLSPLLVTWGAFLLMYFLIPYTKIKIKSAMVGGAVGALLWEMMKNFFVNSAGVMVKNDKIYGSIALVPTFLIWLYFTWLIVLIGLEVAYTHQNFKALLQRKLFQNPAGKERLALTLKFFTLVAKRFHQGGQPPDKQMIAERFDLPTEVVESFVDRLEARKLIHRIGDGEEGFVPARSLDNITLREVAEAEFLDPESASPFEESTLDKQVDQTLNAFEQNGMNTLGEITVLDYIRSLPTETTEKAS